MLVPISSYRYKPRQNDDGLRERLIALAREKPRFGYRRLHALLGREGEQVNHKRVHRIYREAGLALRRKKRKHCVRLRSPLGIYTAANQEWALDFVHDAVASGRSIRVLNVIDAYTRESLAMEVDTSFAGLGVTRKLDQIIAERGLPRAIRCDNGPELTVSISWPGLWIGRSTWCTSSGTSPRRTPTWRVGRKSKRWKRRRLRLLGKRPRRFPLPPPLRLRLDEYSWYAENEGRPKRLLFVRRHTARGSSHTHAAKDSFGRTPACEA